MYKKQIVSTQKWLPYKYFFENGIIKLKDDSYVKVIEVVPINFNLKSELEKQAIIYSYKVFLNSCNFDIQILIQSDKKNLSNHIKKINDQKNKENKKIKIISENYINYINYLNLKRKSSNKNYYIILKKINKKENFQNENLIIEELNEKYFKIKENLSRCGNIVKDISEKNKIGEIINSFYNKRIYYKN